MRGLDIVLLVVAIIVTVTLSFWSGLHPLLLT
jgi:hypothetical protein